MSAATTLTTAAAAPAAPRRMTLEAWADLPEDEPGELVDGELVEEETGSFVHDLVVGWFIAFLRGWVVPRKGLVAVRYDRLVSPELRTIEILELGADGRYIHAQNIATGVVSRTGCDGLTLDADALWKEVEDAENEEPGDDE